MSLHVGKHKLTQTGMEATRNLVYGVAFLCVMPCTALVILASYLSCDLVKLIFGECGNFVGVGPFTQTINLMPAIYGPVILLVRNKELRAARPCQISG